jgi:hypothetical protein
MAVIIEIDAPHLLPQLVSRLLAADCWAAPISSYACRVVHRRAESADEAMRELRFFASAWAGTNGNVTVRLRPSV